MAIRFDGDYSPSSPRDTFNEKLFCTFKFISIPLQKFHVSLVEVNQVSVSLDYYDLLSSELVPTYLGLIFNFLALGGTWCHSGGPTIMEA